MDTALQAYMTSLCIFAIVFLEGPNILHTGQSNSAELLEMVAS